MHYNIVCDETKRTVFIMSSQGFNKKLFESNVLLNYSAEISSALLILFDLLKNAVCIPCPINNNFEMEPSLFQ